MGTTNITVTPLGSQILQILIKNRVPKEGLCLDSAMAISQAQMASISADIDTVLSKYNIETALAAMMKLNTVLELVVYVKELMTQGISQRLAQILVDHNIPELIIKDDAELTTSQESGGLGIAPNNMALIVGSIENKFRISIDVTEELPYKETVRDLINYIKELL